MIVIQKEDEDHVELVMENAPMIADLEQDVEKK